MQRVLQVTAVQTARYMIVHPFGNAIGDGAVYNVGLNTKETNLKEWVVKGLISTTSYRLYNNS